MNIAIDARELAGRPTGVGRYLASLLEQWAASPAASRHQWRLWTHAPVAVPSAFFPSVAQLDGGGGTRWEQWALARALASDRPDVLFAPGYTAPLTAPCPVALTVHDVSFLARPDWFAPRERWRRRVLTTWSARRARVVLTDSAFSQDEIVRRIGIPSGRVRVIPLGIDVPADPPAAELPAHREPVVLYVGSIFSRRHVDRLIEVFAGWVAPRVPHSRLEIVGDNRLYPPGDPAAVLRTCPPDIARRITLRSYVDDQTLHDLYARATVFAFLSEYEGFGLTPLEALARGVPPVVLDTAVAREVYGPAARYVADLTTPDALGAALVELLTDDAARTALVEQGRQVLQRYDWERTAARTLEAIEEAGRG